MDFGKAFSFPFQDPDWARKVIIPALIGIIPIIGQMFVLGWALGITRRVMHQDPTPLPELNFGDQLLDGLKALVIGLVYALPIIIISVPLGIVSGAATSSGADQETISVLIALVSVCCYGIIFIYSLLLALVIPAAYAKMLATDNLGAAFQFGEVIGVVRTAPGPYLLVFVGTILTGLIAPLGIVLCGIGVFLTYAYAMAVNGHLYGQAYNEATQNLGYSS